MYHALIAWSAVVRLYSSQDHDCGCKPSHLTHRVARDRGARRSRGGPRRLGCSRSVFFCIMVASMGPAKLDVIVLLRLLSALRAFQGPLTMWDAATARALDLNVIRGST